jgi:hypothetical protein
LVEEGDVVDGLAEANKEGTVVGHEVAKATILTDLRR